MPLPGQPVTHYLHDDRVRGDCPAVDADGQQRPFREPPQRPVHQFGAHLGPAPAFGQDTRRPGGMQEFPADPGPRQHRHDLHHPGRYARIIGRPDRLQGQQNRLRHVRRVRLRLLLDQVLPDRHRPQPFEVLPVSEAPVGDYRRGLSQRQRQAPQLGGYLGGSLFIRQAGPPVQERQRLIGTEHAHRDAGSQVCRRRPGRNDEHLGCTTARNYRPQHVKIFCVVEYQQATVSVGLEPAPYQAACVGRVPPGTAIRQCRSISHGGQASLQAAGVLGVNPGDQPPAPLQPRPGVCGRQLRLAHP